MKRLLKKIFSKATLVILICILGLLAFFYWNWIEAQAKKLQGVYYVYKGDQAYYQDNLGKTLEYYHKGLDYYPGHYEAWFNLGNIYAVYEDYYSAVDAYEHAIKYNPNYVLARMNLGIVYSESLGFFDEAIEQFDKIPEIKIFKLWIPFVFSNIKSVKANKGIAYYNRGVAYKQKAMYLPMEKRYLVYKYLGDAIESYEKALKYLKKNYDLHYNKAVVHHLRDEYKEAGVEYCNAIRLEPMKFEAHYNLAVLLREINHHRDSMQELQKATMLILEEPSSSPMEATYIFNLLNEATRNFITSNEYYTQKLTDDPIGRLSYTYINGKIISDEDFDNAILKNFQNCAGFEYFTNEEEVE